jgi:hypothetical protein
MAQQVADYTGIRREGATWTIYLRGMAVGEQVIFSKAQASLAEIVAGEAQTAQETVATAQQPPEASTPHRVTIVTAGRRDFPGSRVVRGEAIELVQIDDGQTRPPKKPFTLAQALTWLGGQGFEPESMTSTGMANWVSLSGGSRNVEARRKCVFVRRAA